MWAFILVSCEVLGAEQSAGCADCRRFFSFFPEAVATPTADNKVKRNLETQLGQR